MADKLDLARRNARLKQYRYLFELASHCWDGDWDVNGAAQDIFLDYVEALLDQVTLEEAKWWENFVVECGFHDAAQCVETIKNRNCLRHQRIAALESKLNSSRAARSLWL